MPTWTDALPHDSRKTNHACYHECPPFATSCQMQVHTQVCMAWNIHHLQVIKYIDHSSECTNSHRKSLIISRLVQSCCRHCWRFCNNSDCILFQNTIRTWHEKRMKPFQPNNTIQQHQGLEYYLAKAFKTTQQWKPNPTF
jgi:hypothetical protein